MSKTLKIVHDTSPENPREWDNLAKLACFHKRYGMGDMTAVSNLKHAIRNSKKYNSRTEDRFDLSSPVDLLNCALHCNVIAAHLPIYMYQKGGFALSTKPFSCPWDSGQLGFGYILKDDAKKAFGVKRMSPKFVNKLESIIESELDTYGKYISGEVYGYELYEGEELIDSCYGFYTDDIKNNGMADYVDLDEVDNIVYE